MNDEHPYDVAPAPARGGGFLRRRGCVAALITLLVLLMLCYCLAVGFVGLYYGSPAFQEAIWDFLGA